MNPGTCLLVCSNGSLSLIDPSLQGDPLLMRRLHWAGGWAPLLLAWCRCRTSVRVAQRLQLPGQQQQWLRQMVDLKQWLLADAHGCRRSRRSGQPETLSWKAMWLCWSALCPFNGNLCCAGGGAGGRSNRRRPRQLLDRLASGPIGSRLNRLRGGLKISCSTR